jgi:hypothetical protein
MISPTKIKTAGMATILHPLLPIGLAQKNSKPSISVLVGQFGIVSATSTNSFCVMRLINYAHIRARVN